MKILKNKQLNAESYSVFSIKSKNKRLLFNIEFMIRSHIGSTQNYEVILKLESLFHLSGQTFRLNYSEFYRCLYARVVVVVLVWVAVSSQYDGLVLVVVVRRLFMF